MRGPNAVNGVINIITKSARANKGAQASIAAGPRATE
jgi:outer membrane cobalamin receptor